MAAKMADLMASMKEYMKAATTVDPKGGRRGHWRVALRDSH